MANNYLTSNSFGGIYRHGQLIVPVGNPAGAAMYSTMHNFRGGSLDYYASLTAPTMGVVKKAFAYSDYKGVMAANGRARGAFLFYPSNSVGLPWGIFAQCTTDYNVSTIYALDIANNVWKTLATGFDGYHCDGEQWDLKFYLATASDNVRKWWRETGTAWDATLPIIKDKAGVASAIAGATLTWNLTATVTSDIDISAAISPGDWIRRSAASPWWDEVQSVAAGGLSITLMAASGDNGASAAGGAQKAASKTGFYPLFLKVWKGKLWCACDLSSDANYSTLYWSQTNDAESWDTTLGAGSLAIGDDAGGEIITGLGTTNDYLFVFKDTSYYVFKWTGDLDEPIEQVAQFPYGCASERTIMPLEQGLIYYTGLEVRWTNGSTDNSLSSDIEDWLKKNSTARAYNAFSQTVTDQGYPWATIDQTEGTYSLYLPEGDAGTYSGKTRSFHFSFKEKKWISSEAYQSQGHGFFLPGGTSAFPGLVISTSTATKQLRSRGFTVGDFATAGTIESATLYSGSPNKKLQINWLEIEFVRGMAGGVVDTTVSLNYRQDMGQLDSTKAQTYQVTSPTGIGTDTNYSVKKRFQIGCTCNYWSWLLTESAFGGTAADDIGIKSWTLCYEVQNST